MSLRAQFFLSVVLALVISLSLEAAVACWQARLSVESGMHKALDAGDHIVERAFNVMPPDNFETFLRRLVTNFDGNRHMRVTLVEHGKVSAVSHIAPAEVPDWFVALLSIPIEQRVHIAPGGGIMTIIGDPRDEIETVWQQFRDGAVVVSLSSLLALGLLSLVMRRMAAPLERLRGGFDAVGGGDYGARVMPGGPTELSHLAHAFNRMAEKLDRTESANRRMSRQLLAIQEEERTELARELHDEMGPFLFAMRVDAEAIEAQARQVSHNPIMERARAVGEAVTHIQRHVRLILKQLRPTDFADFGLKAAIENLAGFWRRHVEGVTIGLDIADARDSFGAEADAAIYRLVQEGLTNAVRHGGAKNVWITILTDGCEISVSVEDDGIGFAANGPNADGLKSEGLGLKGMRERLAVLGSDLSLSARAGGGTRLATIIRRQRARHPEPVA